MDYWFSCYDCCDGDADKEEDEDENEDKEEEEEEDADKEEDVESNVMKAVMDGSCKKRQQLNEDPASAHHFLLGVSHNLLFLLRKIFWGSFSESCIFVTCDSCHVV